MQQITKMDNPSCLFCFEFYTRIVYIFLFFASVDHRDFVDVIFQGDIKHFITFENFGAQISEGAHNAI